MALIENTFEGEKNKEQIAIDRIRTYSELSYGLTGKPFYVAYSGGKDSDCIRILCELAEIKYDLVHHHTTVDAPETVYYIRSIPNVQIEYPKLSMWKLIVKNKLPPTRLMRYCCSELKEHGGTDRFVMTGVRWSESNNRKGRGGVEIQRSSKAKNIILNADNDEHRRQFETCIKKGKRILNPIIEWSNSDVWEFLNYYGCKSNPLYECGYKRVGCVGCPMSTKQEQELGRYPKYKANYIKTFDRMLKFNPNTPYNWKSGEEVYKWWVSGKALPKQIEGQLDFENFE